MVKNAFLCFALASIGVIGAALEFGVNNASAADDCITESNLVPPKGTHWDYRTDRAANRKCWFLVKVTTAPVAPQTRRPILTLDGAAECSGQQRRCRVIAGDDRPIILPDLVEHSPSQRRTRSCCRCARW